MKFPELFKRSFVCFSFGKVYNCTGWKIGYCIAPKILMKEFRKVHQFNCFSTNSPAQYALAEFIKEKNIYLELGHRFQQKRDFFKTLMKQTKFKPVPSHGSYFQIYDYSALSDEKENDFALRLTKEAGVVTIPVSAFYKNEINNNVVRFCFAKRERTLSDAVQRLLKFTG